MLIILLLVFTKHIFQQRSSNIFYYITSGEPGLGASVLPAASDQGSAEDVNEPSSANATASILSER
jgi:hypothetical protein